VLRAVSKPRRGSILTSKERSAGNRIIGCRS
jgi:hypothetical protein